MTQNITTRQELLVPWFDGITAQQLELVMGRPMDSHWSTGGQLVQLCVQSFTPSQHSSDAAGAHSQPASAQHRLCSARCCAGAWLWAAGRMLLKP